MKRVLYVAGPLGLAVLVIAAGWGAIAPRLLPGASRGLLVAGLVLLVLGAWARRDALFAQGGLRTARKGAGALASVGIAAAILLLVNFAAARYDHRWDLTREGSFSLHPATRRVLGQVEKDVDVYAFCPAAEREKTRTVKQLFDLFAYHQPRVRVTVADPLRRPELLAQLGLRGTQFAVVAAGERRVSFPIATPDQIRAAEGQLASALLEVGRDSERVVYWVTGHGERPIEAAAGAGYVRLLEALRQNYYQVRSLSLAPGEAVPADAALLVFMDPRKPLPPGEAAVYDAWLRAGHRALVFEDVDPGQGAAPHPMASLLERWGIRPMPAYAVDPRGRTGEGDPRVVVGDDFGQHPAVASLAGSRAVFPLARPIEYFMVTGDQQIFHHGLVAVARDPAGKGNEAFVSRDLASLAGAPRVDPAERDAWLRTDARLALVMAAFRKIEPRPGDPRAIREPRLVLAGDADFVADAHLDREANRELALNIVRWLTGEDLLIRREGEVRLAKTAMAIEPNQRRVVLALGTILPVGSLLLGWVVWFSRRSK